MSIRPMLSESSEPGHIGLHWVLLLGEACYYILVETVSHCPFKECFKVPPLNVLFKARVMF